MQKIILLGVLLSAMTPSFCDQIGSNVPRNVQQPPAMNLNHRVSMDCEERALIDAVDDLHEQTHIEIQYAIDAIPESDHFMPTVTCSLQDVPLNEALKTILSPHGLTYIVEDDVILIIKVSDPVLEEIRKEGSPSSASSSASSANTGEF